MVFSFQFQYWLRLSILSLSLILIPLGTSSQAAQVRVESEPLRAAQALYASGQYFQSARYAFNALGGSSANDALAYAWVTRGLIKSGFYHSAAYFFIRTLQTGNSKAVEQVLDQTETLLFRVGADLFKKYLMRHTRLDQYDTKNRSAYLYTLGRHALLRGNEREAVKHLSFVAQRSVLWPYALQARGTANAILGQGQAAVEDFKECIQVAGSVDWSDAEAERVNPRWAKVTESQKEDLQARCQAGVARAYYQMNRFEEAERAWDEIPKKSMVWPDILFEQAWNAFAKQEYNRTLGKLVTYKSPALQFLFNSEVDVLRAQSYLGLCLYADANQVINEFNRTYGKLGTEIKSFVNRNRNNLRAFYTLGKKALKAPLYTSNPTYRFMNRFVRGPYFQDLVIGDETLTAEYRAILNFSQRTPGVKVNPKEGFPGFLRQVLSWRRKAIQLLGGAYIKNSLIDHHTILISDFEKMAFIKLEMLKRAKEKLVTGKVSGMDRFRGNVMPSRRDDQYRWGFNGEFWNDEIGDYVFGLESECE